MGSRLGAAVALLLLSAVAALAVPDPFGDAASAACPVSGCEPGEEEFEYLLKISISGSGSVEDEGNLLCDGGVCEESFPEGEVLNLSAVPAPGTGQSFVGWGGACADAATGICELTIEEDTEITAAFQDVTPPQPPQISSPTAGEVLELSAGATMEVAFTHTESGLSFLCRMDVGAPGGAEPCASPWRPAPGPGPHTVYVWAKDAAGNISTSPASRNFEVVAPATEEGTDFDGDGSSPPADCNDADPATHPGAADTPGDGIDQDCSGADGSGEGARQGGAAGSPSRVAAGLRARWRVKGAITRVAKLVVTQLPSGARLRVTCRGRGCTFKSRSVAPTGGRAKLTGLLSQARLKAGARLRISITAPGLEGETITVLARSEKQPKISFA